MRQYFYSLLIGNMHFIVLSVGFCLLMNTHSWSQEKNIYAYASLAEKVYLQLNSKAYTNNETIWFKAIVTNTMQHAPSKLSGVLYVELIGPNEKIIEKKIIKIENGVGDGFIKLNQSYKEGSYLIRAYTEWNKNFDTDFLFEEYIQVFTFSKKDKASPIFNIVLDDSKKSDRRLKANFDPFLLDSLHEKNLTLIVSLDGRKDTLLIKKNRKDGYEMEYLIPDESQFITLQIQAKNGSGYSKSMVLDQDFMDLQFFPESGILVHGLTSKIGYKALDANGKGIIVKGKIVNDKGEDIAHFKSNSLGMGSFFLNKVDSSATYFAKLVSNTDDGISLLYPLPKISPLGNVLFIRGGDQKVLIEVSSNYLYNDSIYLRASCRGIDYYEVKGKLKQGNLKISLPTDRIPEGIIAFTMMDGSGYPLAERLYFNERIDSRIKINISSDKEFYEQREMTKLSIETKNDDGEVIPSNLSLLVLNKKQLGITRHRRQNILSYFLLSSDLKGRIENPGFYFSNTNSDKQGDLDALMLTQGWRKYKYTEPMKIFIVPPEKELAIKGRVGGVLFRKKRKEVALTLLTLGNPNAIQTQMTDSLGRFSFDINNEFGNNLEVLLQSENKSGKKRNYNIDINKKKSPDIAFDQVRTIEKIDSITYALVEKKMVENWIDDAFQLSSGVNELDEVVLKTYSMTPQRYEVIKRYGEADEIITGKAIHEKEKKWSYGLYSVLLFNFPDLIEIRRIGHDLYAWVYDSPGPTLVVIDGEPVMEYDYPLISSIPPSEVSSFEIIKSAENFFNLFMTVVPDAHPLEAPKNGNVIAIYTKSGKGLHGVQRSVGILSTTVPVFSPRQEFYAPKYKNLTKDDWIKPDLRALVHWEPSLEIDTLGYVSDAFYNADNTGEMLVIVEAISATGAIGYKELVYEVIKNYNNTRSK